MSTHDHIQYESSARVDASAVEWPQDCEDMRLAIYNGEDSTNWAIFGYKGKTNVLEVLESGNEGIDELAGIFAVEIGCNFNRNKELYDGKPQYGFVRHSYGDEKEKEKVKYIYITFIPDEVPTVKKGALHTHASVVGGFLKGFHIQINARQREDISSDIVMKKIAMTSHY